MTSEKYLDPYPLSEGKAERFLSASTRCPNGAGIVLGEYTLISAILESLRSSDCAVGSGLVTAFSDITPPLPVWISSGTVFRSRGAMAWLVREPDTGAESCRVAFLLIPLHTVRSCSKRMATQFLSTIPKDAAIMR